MNIAIVRPDRLREALYEKLADARQQTYHLWESEQPRLTLMLNPAHLIAHVLIAARGVYATAETFANSQPTLDFRRWYAAWLRRLNHRDRVSWRQLRAHRVAQEHGDGPDLIVVQIDITDDPSIEMFQAVPGTPRGEAWKNAARFASHPNSPASEVCREYLALCQRFVEDFIRDHVHLIP